MRAIVAGANRGIGLELVNHFAELGDEVVAGPHRVEARRSVTAMKRRGERADLRSREMLVSRLDDLVKRVSRRVSPEAWRARREQSAARLDGRHRWPADGKVAAYCAHGDATPAQVATIAEVALPFTAPPSKGPNPEIYAVALEAMCACDPTKAVPRVKAALRSRDRALAERVKTGPCFGLSQRKR